MLRWRESRTMQAAGNCRKEREMKIAFDYILLVYYGDMNQILFVDFTSVFGTSYFINCGYCSSSRGAMQPHKTKYEIPNSYVSYLAH